MRYCSSMITETLPLENLVTQIRERRAKQVVSPPVKSNWQEAYGTAKDDELSREAARLGEEWRKQENKRR